ncbi:MAG: putative transcriptional regulator (GntR-family) [Actinomycetia bacterium]|nr:putative transcriptional regulator (GntR-family) [Actinomycetes bacterium]
MRVEELVAGVDDRSARGIAAGVSRLVRSGAAKEGERLPTVREVASALGVSPTTVSEAWQALTAAGAIEPRGRSGTFVRAQPHPHGPLRYRRITESPGHYRLDLSTGTPDPALLPDLKRALSKLGRKDLTTNYLDDPVVPELDGVLRARWPFSPEGLTVVDGCLDALDRVSSVVVGFGDRVLVEATTFPPLLDLLEDLGAEVIPVAIDEEGLVPSSLEAGLTHDPVALFVQPRSHNPSGIVLTERRAKKLVPLLRGKATMIVEDDHAGDVSCAPLVSFGRHFPERTVHISGFSKSHGPDLRLAAVGGAGAVVESVVSRRRLGAGWSSRILQRVLATMLSEPQHTGVAEAREVYAARRAAMASALLERGVDTGGSDGFYLWVPVRDEQSALVALASQGIGASPGTPFEAQPPGVDHIRVTVGLVTDDADGLADALVAAGTVGTTPRRGRA